MIFLILLALTCLARVGYNIWYWWYYYADVKPLSLGIAFLGYRNNSIRLRKKR